MALSQNWYKIRLSGRQHSRAWLVGDEQMQHLWTHVEVVWVAGSMRSSRCWRIMCLYCWGIVEHSCPGLYWYILETIVQSWNGNVIMVMASKWCLCYSCHLELTQWHIFTLQIVCLKLSKLVDYYHQSINYHHSSIKYHVTEFIQKMFFIYPMRSCDVYQLVCVEILLNRNAECGEIWNHIQGGIFHTNHPLSAPQIIC